MSSRTPLNSEATTFSSITPSSIFLAILFINSSSSITFPPPKISSITILKAFVTEALPPMCPLNKANIEADTTFLTCVAGDKTVKPYCVRPFADNKARKTSFFTTSSNKFLPVLKTISVSGLANKFFNLVSISLIPATLLICLGLETPLFKASSKLLYNQPCFNPNSANSSYIVFLLN